MNVRQLIEELEKIENKDLEVKWNDRYGMGGDCCSNEEYHYHYDYSESQLEDVDEVREESIQVENVNAKSWKKVIVVG